MNEMENNAVTSSCISKAARKINKANTTVHAIKIADLVNKRIDKQIEEKMNNMQNIIEETPIVKQNEISHIMYR